MPYVRADLIDLLSGVLRDGPFKWPELSAADVARVYDTARREGVHLLVAQRVWERSRGRGNDGGPPSALRERLTAALHEQVVAEEIVRPELQRVVAAFANANIPALLIKGSALAYTDYADPVLRPRVDTDVLIGEASRAAAAATLERMDYSAVPVTSGDLVMHQASYARTDAAGVRYVVDVHWQVSNPQVFVRALPVDELMRATISIPKLGESARAPSPAHSLAIACVHRVAHHSLDDRLIWTFDIHLLAERLTDAERERFVAFAVDRQLKAVCLHGLARAQRCFGGEGTARLVAELSARLSTAPEPSAEFVSRPMRNLDVLRSDLGALKGWMAKMALVREHLFPPRAYMRQRYAVGSRVPLPVLYAWRILRGAADWLRPSAATRDEDL